MKIIKLLSRNIKNITAAEISPDGNIVTLTGRNGAGKSAIIDSIFTALTGAKLKDPIRHGEDRAEVVVDMGELVVKKVWTASGERIEVKPLNPGETPQAKLNRLIGAISFDPLSFKDMNGRDQVELLKQLVGLDFSELDSAKEKAYEDRKVLNLKIKESLAVLKTADAPHPDTPDDEISFKESLNRLNDLRRKQKEHAAYIDRCGELADAVEDLTAEVSSLDAQIAELQGLRVQREAARVAAKESMDKYTETGKVEAIPADIISMAEADLTALEWKNAEIRAAKRYRQAIKDGERLRKEADAITEHLKRIDQDKQTLTAATPMPIAGLSLTDEGISYHGILFDRLSTGQQIRVSTAICMALNPMLKVIFIREGSLLDSAGLEEIASLAAEHDYQVWIERCDESGEAGIFIESGEITAINGQKVEKPTEAEVQTQQQTA